MVMRAGKKFIHVGRQYTNGGWILQVANFVIYIFRLQHKRNKYHVAIVTFVTLKSTQKIIQYQ